MWPIFGWFIVFMREVIITQILYGFDQKNRIFWGVVLVQIQWFENGTTYGSEILQQSGKKIKNKIQNCWGKLADNLLHFPSSPILNRVESDLKDSRPVKTIITAIILGNMLGNIKSAVFTYGGIGEGELYCWACMFADAHYRPP